MSSEWQSVVGTGWITVPGFGQFGPRSDEVDGGRQYVTVMLDNGDYAKVVGDDITGGTETWYFEFDQPFFVGDGADKTLEVMLSPLPGGQYAVKFRDGQWPDNSGGGWKAD
jgi:hypothetical protein